MILLGKELLEKYPSKTIEATKEFIKAEYGTLEAFNKVHGSVEKFLEEQEKEAQEIADRILGKGLMEKYKEMDESLEDFTKGGK